MSADELFPIVDIECNTIGSATRAECHSGSMLLHPVVHLHIITDDGCIFLQKRSMSKDIQPGKWDTAVGGHVDYGEKIIDALHREAREELGIYFENAISLLRYDFQSEVERELINVFLLIVDKNSFCPRLDPEEVDEGRFWTFTEVEGVIGKNVLTPNFEMEFQRIKPLITQTI